MTILFELRARAAEGAEPAPDAEILWYHAAFCHFALPAEPGGKKAWFRELAGASVAIEPGGERDRLPGGPWLRRLLMYLCDAALRNDGTQVALGENATALVALIDPTLAAAPKALESQVAALLACRVMVGSESGPSLSVLDARGRPRAVALEWRATLRLNARFLDSLGREKVALDRRVIAQLGDNSLALDIYCWLADALPRQVGQTVLAESWPELRTRFAAPGQDLEAFQTDFGLALAGLRAACPGLECEDDAIGVGFSARALTPPPPVVAPAIPVQAIPVQTIPVAPAPAQAAPIPEAPPAPTAKRPMPDRPMPDRPIAERPTTERPTTERMTLRTAPAAEPPPRPRLDLPLAPAPSPIVEPAIVAPPTPPAPFAPPARSFPANRAEPVVEHVPIRPGQPLRPSISLKTHLTGLTQVIWLQRANGRDTILLEVTPGSRYDPAQVTVLALEPIVLQIAGGLHARDFERVATWATANRDLIDDFWDSLVDDFEEITARVKKVPAPGWR